MTFSTAVMLWNSRMFWNVRATPDLVTLNRFMPSIRLPSNNTWPSVGRNTPVTTLNTVVLPAPLGPINAKISPARTSKRASRSATTPPKRMVTPSRASITRSGRAGSLCGSMTPLP
jgi:hypothetical protein